MSKFNKDSMIKITALEDNGQGLTVPRSWVKTSNFNFFSKLELGKGYVFYKDSAFPSQHLCTFDFLEPPVENPYEERVPDLLEIQDAVGFSDTLFSNGLSNDDQVGTVVANSHGTAFLAGSYNNNYIQRYKKNESYQQNTNDPSAQKESWVFDGPRLERPTDVTGAFGKQLAANGDLTKVLVGCGNKVFLYEYIKDDSGNATWEQKLDMDLASVVALDITKDGESFIAISSNLDTDSKVQVVTKSTNGGSEYEDVTFDLKYVLSNAGANPTTVGMSDDGENIAIGIPDETIGTEDVGAAGVIHIYSKQAATISETDDQGNVTTKPGFKFFKNSKLQGDVEDVPPGIGIGEGLGCKLQFKVLGLNSGNPSDKKYRIITTANSAAGLNPANQDRSRGKLKIYEYKNNNWVTLAGTQFGDSWGKSGGFGTAGLAVNDIGNRIAVGSPNEGSFPNVAAEYNTELSSSNTVPYYSDGVTLQNESSPTLNSHKLSFDALEFSTDPDQEAEIYYNNEFLATIVFPSEYINKPANFLRESSSGNYTAQPIFLRNGRIDLGHVSGAIYIFEFNYVTNSFDLVSKTVGTFSSKLGGSIGQDNTLSMPCLGFRLFLGNPTHDLQSSYIGGIGSQEVLHEDSGIVFVAKISGAEEGLVVSESDHEKQLYLANYLVTDSGLVTEGKTSFIYREYDLSAAPYFGFTENFLPDAYSTLVTDLKYNYPHLQIDPGYGKFKATAKIIESSIPFPESAKEVITEWPRFEFDPNTMPDHASTIQVDAFKFPETYEGTDFNLTYGNFLFGLETNSDGEKIVKNSDWFSSIYNHKGHVYINDGAYWNSGSGSGLTRSWHGTNISRSSYSPGWKEFEVTFESEECPEYSFTRIYKILENYISYDLDYEYNCYMPGSDVFIQIYTTSVGGTGPYLLTNVNIPVTYMKMTPDCAASQSDETLSLTNGSLYNGGNKFYQALCQISGSCSSYECCDTDDCATAYNPNTGEIVPCSEAPPGCEADGYGDGIDPCPCCSWDYIITGENGCQCSGGSWTVPAYQYIGYNWGFPDVNAAYGIDDCVMECDMATDGRDLAECYLNCADVAQYCGNSDDGSGNTSYEVEISLFDPGPAVSNLQSGAMPDYTYGVRPQREEITLADGTTRTVLKKGTATGIRRESGYLKRETVEVNFSIIPYPKYWETFQANKQALERTWNGDNRIEQKIFYVENITDNDVTFSYTKMENYFSSVNNAALGTWWSNWGVPISNEYITNDVETYPMSTDGTALSTQTVTLPPGKSVYIEAMGSPSVSIEIDEIIKAMQSLTSLTSRGASGVGDFIDSGACRAGRTSVSGSELEGAFDDVTESFSKAIRINARDLFYWNNSVRGHHVNNDNFAAAKVVSTFDANSSAMQAMTQFIGMATSMTEQFIENGRVVITDDSQISSAPIRRGIDKREFMDALFGSLPDPASNIIEDLTAVVRVISNAAFALFTIDYAIQGLNAANSHIKVVEEIPESQQEGTYFTPGIDLEHEYTLEYAEVEYLPPATTEAPQLAIITNPHYRQYGQILTQSDSDNTYKTSEREGFGNTVKMSSDGERLFTVGYGIDGPNNAEASILYVYKWNTSTEQWDEEFTYEGDANAKVGFDIACNYDGTKFAASSPQATKVYVFDYSGGSWSLTTTIDGSSSSYDANSFFGWSLDFTNSGDILAIGSPYHGDGGNLAVYNFSASSLISVADGSFTNEESELLGSAVAIGGKLNDAESLDSVVAVGIPNRWQNLLEATQYGTVEIYRLSDNTLVQTIDGLEYQSNFGTSLDFSSNAAYLAIGATGHQYRGGEVHIYSNDIDVTTTPDTHNLIFKQIVTDNTPNDAFGSSVAISDDGRLIVGSPSFDDSGAIGTGASGNDSGRVQMFYCEIATNCNDYTLPLSTASFADIDDGKHLRSSVIDTETPEGQYMIGKNNTADAFTYEYQRLGESVAISSDGERFVVSAPFWYEYTGSNIDADGPKNIGRIRTYEKQTVDEPCVASTFAGTLEDNICHKTSGATDAITSVVIDNNSSDTPILKANMAKSIVEVQPLFDSSQTKTVDLLETASQLPGPRELPLCGDLANIVIEDPNYPIDYHFNGRLGEFEDNNYLYYASQILQFSNAISKRITHGSTGGWGGGSEGDNQSVLQFTLDELQFRTLYFNINQRRRMLGQADIPVPSTSTSLNYYIFVNDFTADGEIYNSCKIGTLTYLPTFSSNPSNATKAFDNSTDDGYESGATKVTFTATANDPSSVTSYRWYKRSPSKRNTRYHWKAFLSDDFRDATGGGYVGGSASEQGMLWSDYIDLSTWFSVLGDTYNHSLPVGNIYTNRDSLFGGEDKPLYNTIRDWIRIADDDSKFSGQDSTTLTLESIDIDDHKNEYKLLAFSDTEAQPSNLSYPQTFLLNNYPNIIGSTFSGKLTLTSAFDYSNVTVAAYPANCDDLYSTVRYTGLPPSTSEYDSFLFSIAEYKIAGSTVHKIPLIIKVGPNGEAEHNFYYNGVEQHMIDDYTWTQVQALFHHWNEAHANHVLYPFNRKANYTGSVNWQTYYDWGMAGRLTIPIGAGFFELTKVQHFYLPAEVAGFFGDYYEDNLVMSRSTEGLNTTNAVRVRKNDVVLDQPLAYFLADAILNQNNHASSTITDIIDQMFVSSSSSSYITGISTLHFPNYENIINNC